MKHHPISRSTYFYYCTSLQPTAAGKHRTSSLHVKLGYKKEMIRPPVQWPGGIDQSEHSYAKKIRIRFAILSQVSIPQSIHLSLSFTRSKFRGEIGAFQIFGN